jgi:hypothetical protein
MTTVAPCQLPSRRAWPIRPSGCKCITSNNESKHLTWYVVEGGGHDTTVVCLIALKSVPL